MSKSQSADQLWKFPGEAGYEQELPGGGRPLPAPAPASPWGEGGLRTRSPAASVPDARVRLQR